MLVSFLVCRRLPLPNPTPSPYNPAKRLVQRCILSEPVTSKSTMARLRRRLHRQESRPSKQARDPPEIDAHITKSYYKKRHIGSSTEEVHSPIDVFAIAPAISATGCATWTKMRRQFKHKAMEGYRTQSPQVSTLNFMEAAIQGNKRLQGLDARASLVLQYEVEAIKYILLREEYVKRLRETYLYLNLARARHLKVQELCHQYPPEAQSDGKAELTGLPRAPELAPLASVDESSVPLANIKVSIPVRRQPQKLQIFECTIKSALGDLVILLRQTRFASINLIEALTKWRRHLPGDRLLAKRTPALQGIGFLWKNVNYLCKMNVDLQFLDKMDAARDLLGLQVVNNPLLLPSDTINFPALHQDLFDDRAYYDRASRADEVLRRERDAEHERARSGVHCSSSSTLELQSRL